jgi:hypothetical protein
MQDIQILSRLASTSSAVAGRAFGSTSSAMAARAFATTSGALDVWPYRISWPWIHSP